MTVPQPTWLTIAEAASLLGCSERSVRRNITKYRTRQVPTKCGGASEYAYQISLDSLPETAQVAAKTSQLPVADPDPIQGGEVEEIAHAYQRLDRRGKAYFDKWASILQQSQHITGRKALEHWVEEWNAGHPEALNTSAPSIYRMREKVAAEGRRALLMPERKVVASSVTDEWFAWFREDYLNQSKLSAALVRILVLGRARNAGWAGSDEEFPSVHAFLRRLEREVSPSLVSFAREGQKRWNDSMGVSAIRDYSGVPVGSVWVADTHTWDVFVQVPGKATPSTVYITAFLDMRTYLPMGWHIHTTAPSTDNTLRAMKRGIDTYGIPDDVYVDHGREYRNKDFSGITRGTRIDWDEQATGSLAARLGFQMHFAIVRNAQAKIIERQFRVMKESFSRLFPSYKGGNVVEKPERLKEVVKSGKGIPTLEEFTERVNQFLTEVFPALPCHGAHHEHLSRAGLWNKYLPERGPLRMVSRETSSMLVSRTAKGRLRDRGFLLAELSCWYWEEWMVVEKGREVTLRYDPEDLSTAWCYDTSMVLLGECQLVMAVGAMVKPGDAVGKAGIAHEKSKRTREAKVLREILPGLSPRDSKEMLADMKAGVGSADIDTGHSLLQLTDHDHDAAQIKREAALGTSDFSRFDPPPGGGGGRPTWYEPDPIAAVS